MTFHEYLAMIGHPASKVRDVKGFLITEDDGTRVWTARPKHRIPQPDVLMPPEYSWVLTENELALDYWFRAKKKGFIK